MINLLVPAAFCAEGGLLDSGLCVRLFTLAGNVYSSGYQKKALNRFR